MEATSVKLVNFTEVEECVLGIISLINHTIKRPTVKINPSRNAGVLIKYHVTYSH